MTRHCRAVRFSRDGALLLTGGADRAIAATDLASGKVSTRMKEAHKAGITRLLPISETALASGTITLLWTCGPTHLINSE